MHWHISVATGTARPLGTSVLSPLVVPEWVFRPRSVNVTTTVNPEDALSWLGMTLDGMPPMPGDLSPAERIAHAREHLTAHPAGSPGPLPSASGYLVQNLISCGLDHEAFTSSLPVREKRFAPQW